MLEPESHRERVCRYCELLAAHAGLDPGVLRAADAGRIEAFRAPGGHRRFRLKDVLRLAEELEHGRPVRPLEPPATPLPALARTLRSHGGALVAAAAASRYREGRPGWFATTSAGQPLAAWVAELADGCERGAYRRALSGSEALLERAAEFGASLLECHAFLERFGRLTTRLLARAGAEHAAIAGTRRLMTAIQQSLIER